MQNGGNEEKKEMEMEIRGKYLAASISTVFTKKLASVLKKKERMLESERDEDQVLEYIYIYIIFNVRICLFIDFFLLFGKRKRNNLYPRGKELLYSRLGRVNCSIVCQYKTLMINWRIIGRYSANSNKIVRNYLLFRQVYPS